MIGVQRKETAMKAPWHLWVIGILTLLWNAVGALDYVMTQTKADWYMSNFTQQQLDYFYGYPAWAVGFWAIGVWAALAGSALLLVRSRYAGSAFALSILGIVGTSVYSFGIADTSMSEITGPGAMAFTAAIVIVAILCWVYARAMRARGVLR
jgi:hypothetical protein